MTIGWEVEKWEVLFVRDFETLGYKFQREGHCGDGEDSHKGVSKLAEGAGYLLKGPGAWKEEEKAGLWEVVGNIEDNVDEVVKVAGKAVFKEALNMVE